jgi:hypothetical protein
VLLVEQNTRLALQATQRVYLIEKRRDQARDALSGSRERRRRAPPLPRGVTRPRVRSPPREPDPTEAPIRCTIPVLVVSTEFQVGSSRGRSSHKGRPALY